MGRRQSTVQVVRRQRTAQPPVALYDLSACAMDEFAHIVKSAKRKKRGRRRLRGSELKRQVRSLDSTRFATPCTFFMYNFKQHKRAGDEWFSKPFYTAPKGYKLSLGVYANGDGNGKRKYVSVFLHLMPGKFDDGLRWPFRGSFTITLLDQSDSEEDSEEEESEEDSEVEEEDSEEEDSDNKQNIEKEIPFGYGTPEDVAGRPRGRRKNCGWGSPNSFPIVSSMSGARVGRDILRFMSKTTASAFK